MNEGKPTIFNLKSMTTPKSEERICEDKRENDQIQKYKGAQHAEMDKNRRNRETLKYDHRVLVKHKLEFLKMKKYNH